ncbi:MAG TPA: portal protein [Alphaproteobacteria bacterium]|nr:portal protein [Alphaproteobacteria bacterium]
MKSSETVRRQFERASRSRTPWQELWRDCYAYALPHRDASGPAGLEGGRTNDRLFDATAADSVEQLAASLLSELTPPWTRWVELCPGTEVAADERAGIRPALEQVNATLQSHFDRSNFAVEIHQCYLDLVTAGTACLLFEEAPVGSASAFRFTAVPIHDVIMEEGPSGRLEQTWRRLRLTTEQYTARFGKEPPGAEREQANRKVGVLEAVCPAGQGYRYLAVLEEPNHEDEPLTEGEFGSNPFIGFRWLKAPGESYGRSPVMTALPDIKTANKVVELILKNASIAVTGIWQADDDGVLNPATIKLVPGAIIPKAVGSSGLAPLQAPGRFDVSELVLSDLRARIRHALLVDRLGAVHGPRMTATEVLERSAEMARILGATHGRLQAELLSPLLSRALSILRRRGEIPDVRVDGRTVDMRYRSPLAGAQDRAEAQLALNWLKTVSEMGAEAVSVVDVPAFVRWFAEKMSVPGELLVPPPSPTLDAVAALSRQDVLADVAAALMPQVAGEASDAQQ